MRSASGRRSRHFDSDGRAMRSLAVSIAVEAAARSGENVVPSCVGAVKAYATIGEIVGRLRLVFGEWRPTGAY